MSYGGKHVKMGRNILKYRKLDFKRILGQEGVLNVWKIKVVVTANTVLSVLFLSHPLGKKHKCGTWKALTKYLLNKWIFKITDYILLKSNYLSDAKYRVILKEKWPGL